MKINSLFTKCSYYKFFIGIFLLIGCQSILANDFSPTTEKEDLNVHAQLVAVILCGGATPGLAVPEHLVWVHKNSSQ